MTKARLPLGAIRALERPKVSQSQVARKAGMGTFRYWQIENGEGPEPTTDEKKAVAAALNIKVADIAWPEVATVKASA